MRRLVVVFGIAVWSAALTPALAQQAASELQGRIVDQQGGVLPGVTIVVRNQETGMFREAISNPDGSFFLGAMTPGVYEIVAELPGFKKYQHRGVQLAVGKTTTVDVKLEVGTVEESVTVTGESPLVDVTSKEVGGYVQSRELVDLPSVNSRNFTAYLGLLPGVVAQISTGSFGADSVNVNGQSVRNVNFAFDGANNNDMFNGGNGGAQARIPIESVQEFQLLTSQFDAEFGGASGGIVNAISKQGTNQLRGTAFGFFKDSVLTAKDHFVRTQENLKKPNTREQQYGGTIGGPVIRDKAHFFFSLERILQDQGVTINIPARPEFNRGEFIQTRVWNTLARFDNQINANHTWGVRYLWETSPQLNQLSEDRTKAAAEDETDIDWTLVGTVNSVLSNTAINTVRLSATREDVLFGNPGFFENDRRQEALPPTLGFNTFTDQQSARASRRLDMAYGADETFAWFVPDKWGDHDMKFGAQYLYSTLRQQISTNLNGTFSFSSDAAFDQANPRTYPDVFTIRAPGALDFLIKGHFISGFAQDKWKVNQRLTLSFGLRYDLEIIPIPERDNPRFASPDDKPVDKNNLSPRVGFSYGLDSGGRSVLRGGYGLFFQRTAYTLINNIISSGVFADSFIFREPASGRDPGPTNDRLPNNPFLRNGPVINRALLNAMFPVGVRPRNPGVVRFDNPDRSVPYTQQVSVGYERQLGSDIAVSFDYIHSANRAQFMSKNLNPGLRRTTGRTATIDRVNPSFRDSVFEIGNYGWFDYDALQVQLDKRFSHGYSARVSYTRSRGFGNTATGQNEDINTQLLDDLRLDQLEGPTSIDRPHILAVSGTLEVPRTGGLRISGALYARSGTPFTLTDSTTDPDRNGFFQEPLPSGTYSGTGRDAVTVDNKGGVRGARGPGFFEINLKAGYVFRFRNKTLQPFFEVFNVTNRSNFTIGSGDRRNSPTFLVVTGLQGRGPTRSGQFGMRYTF